MNAQVFRWQRAARHVQFSFLLFARFYRKAAFNPDQPRDEFGRWTDTGGGKPSTSSDRARLASSDKPRLGRSILHALAVEAAKRLIEAYRKQNFLFDLLGDKEGVVAVTTVNDADFFGVNSTSSAFSAVDRQETEILRRQLIREYPDTLDAEIVGRAPNNALYHAETNVLLRAARANNGTLEGKALEIYVDRDICPNCEAVLPFVGKELGNPTVSFRGPGGKVRVMKNGSWIK